MENADFERIEKYFRQELTEAEQVAFEQRLATDEAFRQEVVLHERALAAIRFDSFRDLKNDFRQQEAALRQQKNSARKRWLAALLLPFLLAGGWFFWKKNSSTQAPLPQSQTPPPAADSLEQQKISPPDTASFQPKPSPEKDSFPAKPPVAARKPDAQKLFAEAFQTYRDASLNPSVRDEKNPTPFEQFLQFYWENKHSQALAAFENLSPALRASDDALFLKANSLLATGQAVEAAALFEGILANGTSSFAGQSRWYLALCFLKAGELDAAKKQLEKLVSDGSSPRKGDALKLLEKLR